jgi:hypothetical protein
VERTVAQDAGVGDHAVDASEGVQRGLHDRGAAGLGGDAVVVRDRGAAAGLNLLDHGVGRGRAGAGAVAGTAEVVDHDLRAGRGQLERVLPTQAVTRTGDDDDPVLHSSHDCSSARCQLGHTVQTPRSASSQGVVAQRDH